MTGLKLIGCFGLSYCICGWLNAASESHLLNFGLGGRRSRAAELAGDDGTKQVAAKRPDHAEKGRPAHRRYSSVPIRKFTGSNNLLSRRKCCVPEHWCDSPSVWQAVEWLQRRLADGGTAQLVPVVHRRDPRARAATATSLAARRAGGPCGPTGASVLPERRRRSGPAQGKAAPCS
jgi:hypothetical protein